MVVSSEPLRGINELKSKSGTDLTEYGGDDETRTRDLCRDRARMSSTHNNLQGCWGLPSTW